MSVEAWTDAENDLIVADDFAMLADELARRPYSKRSTGGTMPVLRDRPNGSGEVARFPNELPNSLTESSQAEKTSSDFRKFGGSGGGI